MISGIGKSVRRKEDQRFITGSGRYSDDISLPNQLHLYVLRSPVAHARLKSVDTTAAASAEGVVAVYAADDLERGGVTAMLTGWPVANKDGSPMADPPRVVLATDKLAYVGQPIVGIIAESRLLAKDAAELIEFEYEELPAIVDTASALAPDSPQIWEEAPNNLSFDWEIGDQAATAAAFAEAAHVVEIDTIQNRLVPSAMEPRALVCEYDAASEEYTMYVSHQAPHLARFFHARSNLNIPEHKLRVVAPDVGGGFGSKSYQYSEEMVALYATKQLGRPVKWASSRSEAFLSDAHARDHVTHSAMALDENGKILAVKSSVVANLGAFISLFGAAIPTVFHATMLTGVYAIPACYSEVKGVLTNTVPTDAYRGAGRPEAAYTIERLIETAAVKLNIDSIELRRRNFIPPDAFPYTTALGMEYDSGEYAKCLDLTLAAADYTGFEERRAEAATRGKLRGIGVCVYVEVAGPGPSAPQVAWGAKMAGYEAATVRVNSDATVKVMTGTQSHGQGHETTFAQIVSEQLSIPIDDIEIIHGDTSQIPFGQGTYGSRSLTVGGSAIFNGVNKIIHKGKKIAAHMLEAPLEEIDFIEGFFKVGDTDRILAFKDVAFEAYVPGNYPLDVLEPGLEETAFYDPPNFTFPAGAHCCELEVDPETGVVEILNYNVGDDLGVIINPMIVDGQIHGGLAQGIGQALMENTQYDPESGQPLSGSFLDYCMPRADNLPMFGSNTIDGYSATNPLGAKGAGEAGTIGAPVTVMNAVLDALGPIGITDLTMPATSNKIWTAINSPQGDVADSAA
ncbi:MAG TPA: carbon monoxide dehydrogenase [Gammaproteobacteria bacterium]|nr:carbon monoxide dehydrogenase [Gammaproteobacteria bacterium]